MAGVTAGRAASYTFVDLGAQVAGAAKGLSPYFYGAAINDRGAVVFNVMNEAHDYRAFVFDGSSVQAVSALAAESTWAGSSNAAADINLQGEIVGHSRLGPNSAATHAFLFRNGAVRDIGPAGREYSEALRINDQGEVLGAAMGAQREFWVRRGDRTQWLADVVAPGATGVDLNNRGHVLGVSARGVFLHDLATGSTSYLDGVKGSVAVLSDRDEIASVADYALYRWQRGRAEKLGSIGGGVVFVRGMNTLGDIVGVFRNASGGLRAFVYSGGNLSDLNALIDAPGWVLTSADGINNRGEIVGAAVAADGSQHAFLLRPIR